MTVVRPAGLRSGFHAHLAHAGVPGLVHAGDQHAPASWFIDRHRHTVWELYLQTGGPPTRWEVAGRGYDVPPGTLLAVPPDTEHRMVARAPAAFSFLFAALDVDAVLGGERASAWWRREAFAVAAPELTAPFEAFLREVVTSQRLREEGLRHTAAHLLVEVTRLMLPDGPRRRHLAAHPAVAEARRLLEADLAARLRVEDVAARVHLAPAYLTALFTAQMGVSPARHRARRRLHRARILLAETDLSVTEIAADLGFSSPQHLATAFRRETGTTPGAFRRTGRSDCSVNN